jgi:hypothetical protein
MDSNFVITSEHAGGKYKLLFNESFLLLQKNDKVSIKLPAEANSWEITLNFENRNDIPPLEVETDIVGGVINYKLNKWYHTSWIENIKPAELVSTDGKVELLVKIRSEANQTSDFHAVTISIWKKTI